MKFLIATLALIAVVSAQQPPIAILRQAQDVAPDGSYKFNYDTENGITVLESGAPGPVNEKGQPAVVSQGQYQYTAPDGTPISVSYTADENGFQAQGAHIPAIPESVLRALEWNAAHPEEEDPATFAKKKF